MTYCSANWLEEYFDKNGKYESRYEGKLKYRALTMMWSEGGVVSHRSEKERKLSLILIPESRNSECLI